MVVVVVVGEGFEGFHSGVNLQRGRGLGCGSWVGLWWR